MDVFDIEGENDIGLVEELTDVCPREGVRRSDGMPDTRVDHWRADHLRELCETGESFVGLGDVAGENHGSFSGAQRLDHPDHVIRSRVRGWQ